MPTFTITQEVTIDFIPLDTRAKVDDVVERVTFDDADADTEETLQERDDRHAARSQSRGALALAKKDQEILIAQGKAAVPGLMGQEKQDADDRVEALVSQRKTIVRVNRATGGVAAVLDDIEAALTTGDRTFYTALLAALATHRAGLTA